MTPEARKGGVTPESKNPEASTTSKGPQVHKGGHVPSEGLRASQRQMEEEARKALNTKPSTPEDPSPSPSSASGTSETSASPVPPPTASTTVVVGSDNPPPGLREPSEGIAFFQDPGTILSSEPLVASGPGPQAVDPTSGPVSVTPEVVSMERPSDYATRLVKTEEEDTTQATPATTTTAAPRPPR